MSIHSLLRTTEAAAPNDGVGLSLLEGVTKPPLDVGENADCCCAAAQVRVVLAPVAGRNSRPELRLCAHHYRSAAARLTKAGADVYDARGRWLAGHEIFWADSDGNSKPAEPLSA